MIWQAEPATLGWVVRGLSAPTPSADKRVMERRRIVVYDNWNALTKQQARAIAAALNDLEANSPEVAGVIFRQEGEPTDVHTEHCCVLHGCKYGNADCTVVTRHLKQSARCEHCIGEE